MPSETPSQSSPARILFVDDDPDNLEFFTSFSELYGYEPRCVQFSQRAYSTAVETMPDLIVLDVDMPVMDGFEVFRQLRADERFEDTPIFFLTARATDVESKVKGINLGAWDYLLKPIEPSELNARVERQLAQSRRLRQLARREVDVVRETAVFLTHSINNLLTSIQLASDLLNYDIDEKSKHRTKMITQSVERIHEVIGKLKDIKQVVLTTYVGDERMLDLDESVKKPKE